MTSTVIACALGSALFFAIGNSLQHLALNNESDAESTTFLTSVRGNPVWFVGAGLGLVAVALHVAALDAGDVGVVQPLLLTGVVMAGAG